MRLSISYKRVCPSVCKSVLYPFFGERPPHPLVTASCFFGIHTVFVGTCPTFLPKTNSNPWRPHRVSGIRTCSFLIRFFFLPDVFPHFAKISNPGRERILCITLFFLLSFSIFTLNQMNRDDVNTLYRQFRNVSNPLFLETDTRNIYQEVKRQALLDRVTRNQIERFKSNVETISRSYSRRILRDRPRYLQYRNWLCYGPNNILLGNYFTARRAVTLPLCFQNIVVIPPTK